MNRSTKEDTPRNTVAPLTRRGLLGQCATLALAMLGGASAAHARQASKEAVWDSSMELVVDFEISPADGFRYRRPFVVVWIEDKNGKEARTLSLWAESNHGTRWLTNLRRWYRDAHDYWAAGGPDLILSMSSATRQPGKYSLTWDGKDDKGKLLPQGTYTLNLESAREHGPYGLIQKEIVIGPKPLKVKLTGSGDIQEATIDYRKRA